MNTIILIIILNIGSYSRPDNSSVTFQEFNTMAQCQYAAKLIRDSAKHIASLQCVNK
jgi:hypothetical protein